MNGKRLQEIALVNQMPINQRAYQLLARIQREDPGQAIADDTVHLVQLLLWGILDAYIKIQWTNQDEMFGLLTLLEKRLTPQEMMVELTMDEDGLMITDEMLEGSPVEVAENLLDAWISKKIGQGIILTRDDLDLE